MFLALKKLNYYPDWFLISATIPLVIFGLITMNSFLAESYFFNRQITWLLLAYALLLALAFGDWRLLRQSWLLVTLYSVAVSALAILLVLGQVTKGAQSWLSLGGLSLQPADFMKLILVLMPRRME